MRNAFQLFPKSQFSVIGLLSSCSHSTRAASDSASPVAKAAVAIVEQLTQNMRFAFNPMKGRGDCRPIDFPAWSFRAADSVAEG
jgi:hypothetical protein